MGFKINCIYNDDGAWCKNKRIKRSLFGIGARVCLVAEGMHCKYRKMVEKPPPPPPPPPKKRKSSATLQFLF